MKKSKFLSRLIRKGETLTKDCDNPKCISKVFDGQSFCEWCLVNYYAEEMPEKAGGGCDHYDTGYTRDQVVIILRRALKEPMIFLSGTQKKLLGA